MILSGRNVSRHNQPVQTKTTGTWQLAMGYSSQLYEQLA
jgi:hypothetical protein